MSDDYKNQLMIHYCFLKMNIIIRKDFSVHDAATVSTKYYQAIMNTLNNFLQVPTFPILSNKKMYEHLLPKQKPVIEGHYPLFNWSKIWKNFSDIKINQFDREIIYKHLHGQLATNSRLARMNIANCTGTCPKCNDGREQTALHLLYECTHIITFYQWFLSILMIICRFKPKSNIKFLYFDDSYLNAYQKRTINMLLSLYITIVWRTRKENLRIGILKKQFIKKVVDNIEIRRQIPGQKLGKIYGEYLNMLKVDVLNNML